MANITFLPVQDSIKLGGEKVIALNQANIDAIKTSYSKDVKVLSGQNTISNKDLLSQSFGASPAPSVPEVQVPSAPSFIESASVNLTPNNVVQDLESIGVNMNASPSINTNSVNNLSEVNAEPVAIGAEPVNENPLPGFTLDMSNSLNFSTPVLDTQQTNLVSKESTLNPVNSEFNVSSAPNIFDLPPIDGGVSQNNLEANNNIGVEPVQSVTETVAENSPILTINSDNDVNMGALSNESNIFSTPNIPSVDELKDTQINQEVLANGEPISMDSLNFDILEARIAIEKSNYNLYMSLADNSKKMAELLEKQLKKNEIDNTKDNLENTASYLFNSNGVLDEAKVLGLNKVA